MGSANTTLNIEPYFQNDIIIDNAPIEILINLEIPAVNRKGESYSKFLIQLKGNETMTISEVTDLVDATVKRYDWTPKSHMRDFEVISPHNENEIRIARGQGIGVIIVEQRECYIKLMYDKTSSEGIIASAYTIWTHSEEARGILSSDLSIGYDVLHISKDKIVNLIEEIDERDRKGTMILFSDLEKYGEYNYGVSEEESEDENEDEIGEEIKINMF